MAGAALLTLLMGSSASAESTDKEDAGASDPCMSDAICRAHYNRARKLSKKDDYEGALDAYESAFRRKPVSWLLINIGRSQHKLGRTQEAIHNYQRFLAEKEIRADLRQKAEQFLHDAQTDLASRPVQAPKEPDAGKEPAKEPAKEPDHRDAADKGSGPGNLPPTGTGPQQGAPVDLANGSQHGAAGSSATDGSKGAGLAAPVLVPLSVQQARSGSGKSASRLGPLFYGGLAVGGVLILGGIGTGIGALVSSNTLQSTTYSGSLDASSLPALQRRTRGLGYATDVLIPLGVATIAVTTIVSLVRKPAQTEQSIDSIPTLPATSSTAPSAIPSLTPNPTPVLTPGAMQAPSAAPNPIPNPTP